MLILIFLQKTGQHNTTQFLFFFRKLKKIFLFSDRPPIAGQLPELSRQNVERLQRRQPQPGRLHKSASTKCKNDYLTDCRFIYYYKKVNYFYEISFNPFLLLPIRGSFLSLWIHHLSFSILFHHSSCSSILHSSFTAILSSLTEIYVVAVTDFYEMPNREKINFSF